MTVESLVSDPTIEKTTTFSLVVVFAFLFFADIFSGIASTHLHIQKNCPLDMDALKEMSTNGACHRWK